MSDDNQTEIKIHQFPKSFDRRSRPVGDLVAPLRPEVRHSELPAGRMFFPNTNYEIPTYE